MRDVLGPALTTLACAAGAAVPQAMADETCAGASCAGASEAAAPQREASASDHWLVGEMSPEAARLANRDARSPQYDVSGLMSVAEFRDGAPGEAAHSHRRPRMPVSTAYAPPLAAADDTCMGSRNFGVQAVGFGVSFAATWGDRQCRRIKNARALDALGYRSAALALLCQDRQVRRAMDRAGAPCPGGQLAQAPQSPREPQPAAAPPPLIAFDNVLFDFDRATLRAEADRVLEPLLAMMRADAAMAIDIEGHTDWMGSDAYNQRLSQRRAQAVVEWLVAHGISRERIGAVGRGESEPVASNATAAGRQRNRRVEIRRRSS
jgi:outer membrane protein OmpA-like peptidoglycan-associated protein